MKQLFIIISLLSLLPSCTEDQECSTCIVTVNRSINDVLTSSSSQEIDFCDAELDNNINNPVVIDTIYTTGDMVVTTYIYACH